MRAETKRPSRPIRADPARDQILPARAFRFLVFRPGGDCLPGVFHPGMSIQSWCLGPE